MIYKITYSSNSSYYKEPLNYKLNVVVRDEEIAKVIQVPPYSGGYWALTTVVVGILLITTWLMVVTL